MDPAERESRLQRVVFMLPLYGLVLLLIAFWALVILGLVLLL